MNNLLLNFLFGDRILDSIDAEIYLSSINKFKSFKKLICVNNVSEANIERLKKYYDYVVRVEETLSPYNFCYLSYYNWLCENGSEFDYVMHCDMRDVIMQKDPFVFMENHPDKELFLVSEGMKIYENSCNEMWHDWVLETVTYKKESYKDSYILNGGTYGGRTKAFLNYCSLILIAMNRKYKYMIPDQAMMGYLCNHFGKNPNIMLTHPYKDNFCATGEAIKRENINVNFDGKQVQDLNNNSYYLFHQWDRTVFAEQLRENYKNKFTFMI